MPSSDLRVAESQRFFLLLPDFSYRKKASLKSMGNTLRKSTTNVGYMLQHDEFFEWRTIYNNVILGLEIQHMLTAEWGKGT